MLFEILRWKLFLILSYFCSLPLGAICGIHEKRLLSHLFNPSRRDAHNLLERPVKNDLQPLYVWFKVSLQQIIDVDEKMQIASLNLWLDQAWTDYHFVWNASDFGGINKIQIDPKRVWRPDILLYNSADEKFDATYATNVVITSDGTMSFIPPGMFKSTCKIDITWFPFDRQKCELKFGSWTYDGSALDLRFKCGEKLVTVADRLNDPQNCSTVGTGDISTYTPSGEWDLLDLPGVRNSFAYECCPQNPYIDLTFWLNIRRRKLYYIFNLIGPCAFLACLALLSFIIPPDAGEKVSFGVTILLSLTVFLMMVAEAMPPTSDAVPVIGMYFACTMIMCSLSVVFTVIVLNYHHRDAESHPIPNWVRKIICTYLAQILFMQNPALKKAAVEVPYCRRRQTSSYRASTTRDTTTVELKERSSKSLLANVLDLEDDIRTAVAGSPPSYSNCVQANGVSHQNCSTKSDLAAVLEELRTITKKIAEDDKASRVSNEWKFAARVVDRLCLILFSMFTLISTCAILFSAPDVFAG